MDGFLVLKHLLFRDRSGTKRDQMYGLEWHGSAVGTRRWQGREHRGGGSLCGPHMEGRAVWGRWVRIAPTKTPLLPFQSASRLGLDRHFLLDVGPRAQEGVGWLLLRLGPCALRPCTWPLAVRVPLMLQQGPPRTSCDFIHLFKDPSPDTATVRSAGVRTSPLGGHNSAHNTQ